MRTLLSIGDFARMTFLSVKALRHYHEVGLLVPASIDPATGYRRYDLSQVAVAHVIRRFRELGVPLEDLMALVQAPDVHVRNATIVAHLQRMEQQLERTRAVVASLRDLIERTHITIPVEYRTIPAVNTIAIREFVASTDAGSWLGAALGQLRSALETLGDKRAGADGALYSSELFEQERGELVAFIPVQGTGNPSARVENLTLPVAEFAVAVHRGSFASIDQTYGALGVFVAKHAISVGGPIREHYLIGAPDTLDETQHRTEVCWPIFQTTRGDLP